MRKTGSCGRKASSRHSKLSESSFSLSSRANARSSHLVRRIETLVRSLVPGRTGSVVAAREDGEIISTAASEGGSYIAFFSCRSGCSCCRFPCSWRRHWRQVRCNFARFLFRRPCPRQIKRAVIEFDDVSLANHPVQIGRERQFPFLGFGHLSIRAN